MTDETYPKPIDPPDILRTLAKHVGGTITECAALPDGSGFAMMSMPLPKDHWSLSPDTINVPPMPLRLGVRDAAYVTIVRVDGTVTKLSLTRIDFHALVRDVGRYAFRCASMNGKETDIDPDALIQNLQVGMTGYNTETGLSEDAWANPA